MCMAKVCLQLTSAHMPTPTRVHYVQIIQIVMGVIGALITINTIGHAIYALVPILSGGIASIVGTAGAGLVEVATGVGIEVGVEAGVDAGIAAIEAGMVEVIPGTAVIGASVVAAEGVSVISVLQTICEITLLIIGTSRSRDSVQTRYLALLLALSAR